VQEEEEEEEKRKTLELEFSLDDLCNKLVERDSSHREVSTRRTRHGRRPSRSELKGSH
jgi:hypothetical protein